MSRHPDPGSFGDRRRHGLDMFAKAWAKALHRAHYVPISAAERYRIVSALAERLVGGLFAEPPDPTCGLGVGEDLVAAGFASPDALGRTIAVLNTRLAADLGLPADAAMRVRLTALLEGLAAGFTAAVHDRSLDAQDAVRLAALAAQARAEQALRANEVRFRHLATHDAWTDLPNRTLFVERLDRIFATGPPSRRVGMCCINLDEFATINDILGHGVGDRLLSATADRLRALAEPSGHLVARFDSDQFAILIEDTTCAEDAVKVADRALTALAEPFHIDNTEIPVTASAGVAEQSIGSGDTAELIRATQIALHWAKADGKARWMLFEHERSAADAERYRLSAAMPAALRHGEFALAYQPLVDLHDGHIAGVEALARWHHPRLGMLGAGQFIELAEHTGLIVPIGRRLLEQACRQASAWQQDGYGLYVNVNIAVRQLNQTGLVASVAQILDRTGLAPYRLQLEVTEHAVIELTDQTRATLAALVELGVRIVIDDFGTGYANLANLRALPLHGLKLDASFARPAPRIEKPPLPAVRQPDDTAFLATVIALGHTLGLTVTAEGIETASQARRMRDAGCDTGQGWHFGRPVPPGEITRRVAGQRR
ncbi:putative bifunctional diguanylate cyclase/phosphodiesterase [Plantactinospora solaniradicis]|uniref:Bifunctional diguanylate cyclase/phosphodiesterase n=1 Tax=Plantactinospora solaniradicis TaxID=1723736 RepID=A0ABW1KMD0_9ACTN